LLLSSSEQSWPFCFSAQRNKTAVLLALNLTNKLLSFLDKRKFALKNLGETTKNPRAFGGSGDGDYEEGGEVSRVFAKIAPVSTNQQKKISLPNLFVICNFVFGVFQKKFCVFICLLAFSCKVFHQCPRILGCMKGRSPA